MTATRAVAWHEAKRVLCVRLDSLGDVLMTTPALRALRGSRGKRHVTLLTSPAGAAAVPHIPEVDDVIEFVAPWMKPSGSDPSQDLDLVRQLKRLRFDAAVIFTVYSQTPLPAAYACYLAGIPLRLAHCHENPYHLLSDWVPDPEPQRVIRHEVRRHLDLVASVGFQTAQLTLSFSVQRRTREAMKQRLNAIGAHGGVPLIVAHPGASAPSRRYPGSSFARALDLTLEEVGGVLVFTGGAEETELVEGIRSAMTHGSHSFAGKLTLSQLGALLAEASLLISNNTGPVHIAAALGTPVVDLYALTNPQHTPWQVRNAVLYADVPCRFCYKSTCPSGHHACLTGVAPESVAEAASRLLDGSPRAAKSLDAVSPLELYPRITPEDRQCTP
jgi:lipopolysaccharide heptosyltransferase II